MELERNIFINRFSIFFYLFPFVVDSLLDADTFGRLLGPYMEIMKRSIGDYGAQPETPIGNIQNEPIHSQVIQRKVCHAKWLSPWSFSRQSIHAHWRLTNEWSKQKRRGHRNIETQIIHWYFSGHVSSVLFTHMSFVNVHVVTDANSFDVPHEFSFNDSITCHVRFFSEQVRMADDTVASLTQRIHVTKHYDYPKALRCDCWPMDTSKLPKINRKP